MGNLPSARPSPRIVNGVIKWYEGDTFTIDLELELEDQDGELVTIGAEDTITVAFEDRTKTIVKEFEFTGVENNTVTLNFDDETTALFGAGEYTYDAYYKGGTRTTVAKDNRATVE